MKADQEIKHVSLRGDERPREHAAPGAEVGENPPGHTLVF